MHSPVEAEPCEILCQRFCQAQSFPSKNQRRGDIVTVAPPLFGHAKCMLANIMGCYTTPTFSKKHYHDKFFLFRQCDEKILNMNCFDSELTFLVIFRTSTKHITNLNAHTIFGSFLSPTIHEIVALSIVLEHSDHSSLALRS